MRARNEFKVLARARQAKVPRARVARRILTAPHVLLSTEIHAYRKQRKGWKRSGTSSTSAAFFFLAATFFFLAAFFPLPQICSTPLLANN